MDGALAAIIAKQRAATEAARATAAAAALAAGNKAPPPVQQPSGAVPGALFGNPTSTSPIHVTSEYGMRLQPVLLIFRLHAGIDLRAPCETPISGFVGGNSVMTAYNHLTRYAVVPRQNVAQGQLNRVRRQYGRGLDRVSPGLPGLHQRGNRHPRPHLGI